jgi:hypothetical protein
MGRLLNKRASFSSGEALAQHMGDFITYDSKHSAEPFQWTFSGKLKV